MASSTHETVVVELTNVRQIAENVTEHVCKLLGGEAAATLAEQCATAVQGGGLRDLLLAILRHMDAVLSSDKADADDCETIYALMYALLRRTDEGDVELIVPEFCQQLTSGEVHGREEVRMAALTKLYSSLRSDTPQRMDVFRSIVTFADRTQQYDVLKADVKGLRTLFEEWNVTVAERRALLLALSEALSHAGPMRARESQAVLLEYLASFDASDDLASLAPHAARAARGAIRMPLGAGCDSEHVVTQLASVTFLKSLPEYAPLYELLVVFCTGTLPDYRAFVKAQPDFEKNEELDHETNVENMRLHTLASLASNSETLAYSVVAAALEIDESEVEAWVVKALTSKVIDAKMDQLTKTIAINRSPQRLFSQNQWVEMGQKLHQWRSAVRSLVKTVQAAREDRSKALPSTAALIDK